MSDIGGGVLLEATSTGSGTGNYDSFFRLQATGVEQGFNTDQNGNVLDNKASFTHSLQWGNLQPITVNGVQYIEFRLDLNENVNANITLTDLRIYISNHDATLTDYNAGFSGFASIFDMAGTQVLTDSNSGSGTDDYRVLVPVSSFTAAGVTSGSYVTLFSSFSGSDGGFEEWRTTTTPGVSTQPGIAIDKVTVDGAISGDGLTILTGEAISWKYTVTNTGNAALSNVVVSDNHGVVVTAVLGADNVHNIGDTNNNGKLDTTETWQFTGSGTSTTGSYANIGSVSASANGTTVTDNDGSSYTGADPEIAIDKVTVDGATEGDGLTILAGEAISWKYAVTNTGNVALSDVGVTDDQGVVVSAVLGADNVHNIGDTNNDGLLDTTETWQFTGSGVAGTGPYSNTGTASGSFTDDAGHKATDTASDGSSYTGADPEIAIDKVTVDGATEGDGLTILAGEAISWKYAVTNTGNVALSDVGVTDDQGVVVSAVLGADNVHNIGDTNNDGLLDTTETWQFTGSGVAGTGAYSNTGTASGSFTDDAGHKATDTASDGSSYTGADPEIAIDKVTVDGATEGDGLTILAGEAISWKYAVTNTGNVALSDVGVTDDQGVVVSAVLGADNVHNIGDTNNDGKLDTTETWQFTGSGVAGTGAYSNTGTASGSFTDDAGHKATDTASDGSSYTGADPEIAIDKVTVDGATEGDGLTILAGEAISWKYTVTNTGNVALSDVGVTDDQGVVVSAVLGADNVHNIGDTNNDGKLDTTETWQFTGSGVAGTGPYSNTGTASGSFTDDAGHKATDTASDGSSYTGADPEIAIDKVTVDGATEGDGLTILAGEAISWKYTVTNTGNVALSDVGVTDDQGVVVSAVLGADNVHNIGDTNNDGLLDTTETWQFTGSGVAGTGPYSNTGTASGSFTDDAGHKATDTASDGSSYTGADPHITLDKKTNGVDHGLNIFQGQAVTWTYDVKNDGNVALANVVVKDDNGTAGTGDDFNPAAITSGGFNTGDVNHNGLLDVGETWHYKATGTAQLGSYVNNATATTAAYSDTAGHSVTPTATDSSDYEGFSSKALTQGFWGSHTDVWDNTPNNEGNPSKSAYASGVLSSLDVNPSVDNPATVGVDESKYLLLGDTNADGIANDAHDLWISISLAKSIESASAGGDARLIMLQQAIATQLNINNGVAQPDNLIDEAVMWLKSQGAWSTAGANLDANNDGFIDTNGAGTALLGNTLKTNTSAWTKYVDVTDPATITDWNGGKEANGEGLKNALMYFNQGQLVTSGPGGHVAWSNGGSIIDEHPNTLDQFWVTLHEVGGLTGIS